MVELAEVQKVRARSELEKIHRGLVVESAPIKVNSISELATNAIDVDVSLAVQIVRDTLEALEEFRRLASDQNEILDKANAEKRRLADDLKQLQKKHDDVTKEASDLRSANQNLQKASDQLHHDRQQLLEHNKLIESKLKGLVGVIVSSFRGDQAKDS